MLEFFFYKVLCLSFTGGIVTAILVVIQWLMGKCFSCKGNYWAWIAALVFFLLPLSFQMPQPAAVPVQVQIPQISRSETKELAAPLVSTTQKEGLQVGGGRDQTPEATVEPPENQSVMELLAGFGIWTKWLLPFLWLVGIAWFGIQKGIRHRRFTKRIRSISGEVPSQIHACFSAVCREQGIRKNVAVKSFPGIGSPFITGILHPVVYLPDIPMPENELRMVLLHELTHVKRLDLLTKAVAQWITVLHFFNPLAYLAQREIDKYCELSCDERVTTSWDTDRKKEYGRTILYLMNQRSLRGSGAAALAEEERHMKRRIMVIMSKNQQKNFVRVISICLVMVFTFTGVVCAGVVGGLNPAYLAQVSYQDVSAVNPYMQAIEEVSKQNLMKGDETGAFLPDKALTRAEMVTIVCRMWGIDGLKAGKVKFEDVPLVHWASGYIRIAKDMQIASGAGNNMFYPDAGLKWEEAVKMLVNALGYAPVAEQEGGYPDGYLKTAQNIGLFRSNFDESDAFGNVGKETSRQVAAQLLANALDIPVAVWETQGEYKLIVMDGEEDRVRITLGSSMETRKNTLENGGALSPKSYYSQGEEVLIGTYAEQDSMQAYDENGNPKPVKRIFINNKGEVVSVLPVEYQLDETMAQYDSGQSAMNSFYWGTLFGGGVVDMDGNSIRHYRYKFDEKTRKPEAVIPDECIFASYTSYDETNEAYPLPKNGLGKTYPPHLGLTGYAKQTAQLYRGAYLPTSIGEIPEGTQLYICNELGDDYYHVKLGDENGESYVVLQDDIAVSF